MKSLKKRWTRFARRLGASEEHANTLFKELEARYTIPKRFYHTFCGHIGTCISEFDLANNNTDGSLAVEAALWFHDSVYNPKANDNETQSAAWASAFLIKLGHDREFIERVSRLIVFTGYTRNPESSDKKLLSDIDLSILGKSKNVFDRYEENIRKEYSWVPTETYCVKRVEILKRFIERPGVFFLPKFKEKYENNAKRNITSLIAKLQG